MTADIKRKDKRERLPEWGKAFCRSGKNIKRFMDGF